MNKRIDIYCGNGRGKSALAIGQCLKAAVQGKSSIVIQFLKGRDRGELDVLEEAEGMDIKVFRFEKMDKAYEELDPQEKEEEKRNIINGVNFARKVIATDECDFLVLDEILGLLDLGIITEESIEELLSARRDEEMHIVMTGRIYPEKLRSHVDRITTITTECTESEED